MTEIEIRPPCKSWEYLLWSSSNHICLHFLILTDLLKTRPSLLTCGNQAASQMTNIHALFRVMRLKLFGLVMRTFFFRPVSTPCDWAATCPGCTTPLAQCKGPDRGPVPWLPKKLHLNAPQRQQLTAKPAEREEISGGSLYSSFKEGNPTTRDCEYSNRCLDKAAFPYHFHATLVDAATSNGENVW